MFLIIIRVINVFLQYIAKREDNMDTSCVTLHKPGHIYELVSGELHRICTIYLRACLFS